MHLSKIIFLIALFLGAGSVASAQEEYNLDETYSMDSNATIYLSSDDAEVSVKGADRQDVHLVVYRRVEVDGWKVNSDGDFEMRVENRGGDLHIREAGSENRRVVIGNVREDYRITMEVPRQVMLDLQGDDDRYEISEINGGVRLEADDSDVELNGVKGAKFRFQIDDGRIEMDEGEGQLNLKLDDGEFHVRNGNFSEIEAETDDGQMEFTTTLSSDGLYRFDMDDGDLELNIAGGGGTFEVDHDDKNISAGSAYQEVRSEEGETVYRLEGGDARIEIDMDDGRVELRTI